MITREEALDLFRSDDLIGIGMEADRDPPPLASRRAWSATSSIATSTTPISARSTAASAPSTGRPGHAEGYILPKEDDLREDSGDARPGRHRRADAGRAASGSQDRVVRGSLPRHQGALSDSPALPLRAGSHEHRRGQRISACATRSRACAMPASIRFPAAARRFWTTPCAIASAG